MEIDGDARIFTSIEAPPNWSLTKNSFFARLKILGKRLSNKLTANRAHTKSIVQIPRSNIYRFGDPNFAAPVFHDVEWTINKGESWAVISGSKQKTAFYPPCDPHNCVAIVSFAHRPRAAGGAFYDYTSRYGAVREEDHITLRESMFGECDFLNIQPKGGKTRRARIVEAILSEPELLVLDEPLTGLNVNTRPTLLNILRSLHESRSLRIIMGLWIQDSVPDRLSHIALVMGETILTGVKDEILSKYAEHQVNAKEAEHRMPVVDMKNVNVSYGPRKVLKNIKWTIREGRRWHLQGANSSGKTTLSLLTGDHPQSYTQRVSPIAPSSDKLSFADNLLSAGAGDVTSLRYLE
ncbi:hypothetical protein C8R48DRAFT_761311 [Suillus tomentosus]|nr:hypothetical protein C8R48DRAFT_761311 [Suillus tomentosus]